MIQDKLKALLLDGVFGIIVRFLIFYTEITLFLWKIIGGMFVANVLNLEVNVVVMFVCAIFLFAIRGNKQPTNIIAFTFVCSGVALIAIILKEGSEIYSEELFYYPDLIGALLLLPPSYFYLFQLMQPGYINKKKIVLIYAPVFLVVLLLFVFQMIDAPLPPIFDYHDVFVYLYAPEMILRILLATLLFMETLFLTFIALRMQLFHQKQIKNNFSYIEGSNLIWVYWVSYLYAVYGVSLFLSSIISSIWLNLLASFFLAITPLVISIQAIKQKKLFEQPYIWERETSELNVSQDISSEQIVKNNQRMKLKSKLNDLLAHEEVFKDPELTVEKVCRMLGTNRTYVSEIINRDMNTTFYRLINDYRLKKAVMILQDAEFKDIPIADISGIVGYKNVSTFITQFKEFYFITPGEWKRNNLLKKPKTIQKQ